MHSLLLENALLDPIEYRLKIAENTRLIGLLSNTESVSIEHLPILEEGNFHIITFGTTIQARDILRRSANSWKPIFNGFLNNLIVKLDLDFELKKLLYYKELKQFNEILRAYDIRTTTGSQASISILKDYAAFKKSALLKFHPDKGGCKKDFIFAKDLAEKFCKPINIDEQVRSKLQDIQPLIHKTNLAFKALDITIDVVRVAYEPTFHNLNKIVFSYAHLYSMRYGVNGFSTFISSANLVQQLYQGDYGQAVITGTIYMALPFGVARMNTPYLAFVHSVTMMGYIGYSAIANAYSFCFGSDPDFELRSVTAYKDLATTLSKTPLQLLYDFSAYTKKYELQINDLMFEREKLAVQAQLSEKGEFGQKIFDYIYLPTLTEKYILLNDITRGTLTTEKAEALKSKHISIKSAGQNYDHCMEIKNSVNSANAKHYYCYNDEQQLLEHVLIGSDNHLEVLERL